MTFDPNKPVQTRSGKPARIICTDLKGAYPIGAAVETRPAVEYLERFTDNGFRFDDEYETSLDLVNIHERHVRWVNVYPPGDLIYTNGGWPSRDQADSAAKDNRIACIRIEFEEGEGLS